MLQKNTAEITSLEKEQQIRSRAFMYSSLKRERVHFSVHSSKVQRKIGTKFNLKNTVNIKKKYFFFVFDKTNNK